jgi:GNAT superfamily N-acetyltransferase
MTLTNTIKGGLPAALSKPIDQSHRSTASNMCEPAIMATAQSSIILEPMNLHDPMEFNELLRQRTICGWEKTSSVLEGWRAAIDAGTTSMFWIIPLSMSGLTAPQRYAGHIALNIRTKPSSEPFGKLWNLFTLPEHRLHGLGRAAVQVLESFATVKPYGSPDITTMELNAFSRNYSEEDGEEGRGLYARVCEALRLKMPAKGVSNEDWYARMGYVTYDVQPMYPVMLEGKNIMLNAALMKKELTLEDNSKHIQ